MPEFEFDPSDIRNKPHSFIVQFIGETYQFHQDTINPAQYHGVIRDARVMVDWVNRPKVAIYMPGITYTARAYDLGVLSMEIAGTCVDYFSISAIERHKYGYPFEYDAYRTGFSILGDEMHIIRFADGTGWLYSTHHEIRHDSKESEAFTNDITPSREHCLSVMTNGEFLIEDDPICDDDE